MTIRRRQNFCFNLLPITSNVNIVDFLLVLLVFNFLNFFTRCCRSSDTGENRLKIGDFAKTRSVWPCIVASYCGESRLCACVSVCVRMLLKSPRNFIELSEINMIMEMTSQTVYQPAANQSTFKILSALAEVTHTVRQFQYYCALAKKTVSKVP